MYLCMSVCIYVHVMWVAKGGAKFSGGGVTGDGKLADLELNFSPLQKRQAYSKPLSHFHDPYLMLFAK